MKRGRNLTIRMVAPRALKPWDGNPRRNEEAVAPVARSIEEFGFNVPILCDKDLTITAGHTRWKAALKLGLRKVPVIVRDLTVEERRAFAVADNRLSETSSWDQPKLREILDELQSEDIELATLGFSEAEVEALLSSELEFDWAQFDEDRGREDRQVYAHIPVKVPRELKGTVKRAIKTWAEDHGRQNQDAALEAGMVLAALLECHDG